jgi:DNA-binding response OmpR family regulator
MDGSPTRRIALVAQDATIAAAALAAMQAAGHVCRHFSDDDTALRALDHEHFDLLLVAGTSPPSASASLLANVHARLGFALPVIGLRPAGDTEGTIAALEEGMDHILGWPAAPRLLVA